MDMKADCGTRTIITTDAHQGKVAAIAQGLENTQAI